IVATLKSPPAEGSREATAVAERRGGTPVGGRVGQPRGTSRPHWRRAATFVKEEYFLRTGAAKGREKLFSILAGHFSEVASQFFSASSYGAFKHAERVAVPNSYLLILACRFPLADPCERSSLTQLARRNRAKRVEWRELGCPVASRHCSEEPSFHSDQCRWNNPTVAELAFGVLA